MSQHTQIYHVQKLSSALSAESPEAQRFRDFHARQKQPIAFLQDIRMGRAYAVQSLPYASYIVEQDGEIVATAIARHYRRLKWGYESWVTHGPVFRDEATASEMTEIVRALTREMQRDLRCLKVQMTPYYSCETKADLLSAMQAAGYTNLGQALDMTVINHLYIRELAGESLEEIIAAYDGNLRRSLPKAEDYAVSCRLLGDAELSYFYQIISDTADRKEFFMQDENYFRAMREAFGEDCLLALAELDLPEFKASQEAIIREIDDELAELEGKSNKKAEGRRKMLSIRRDATRERLEETAEYEGEKIPLAALFCVRSGGELTTIFGGRYPRFNYVRANGVLNHWLLEEAHAAGLKRFNFYGTLELAEAKEGYGNYEFKKGFGGEVEVLAGKFVRPTGLGRWLGRL